MPKRRATSCSVAALLLALIGAGCGYTLSNSSIPSHIKSIAVPVFANSTVEFGLADEVTRAIQESFQANRALPLKSEREADSVLRGTVLTYRNQVFGYTQQERATQYEIVLIARLAYKDAVKNRELWKEDALTVRTTYNVVAVGDRPARTEAEARSEVIQSLADQIVSRTVQGW
jgi:outer membrane lipopolysaccharide assembly protein LptE/RlpB